MIKKIFLILPLLLLNMEVVNGQVRVVIIKEGSSYYSKVYNSSLNSDTNKFFIGRATEYGCKLKFFSCNLGLENCDSRTSRLLNDSRKYSNNFLKFNLDSFWCKFLFPIAIVEGDFFNSLNTYDEAKFTIGPFQFSAQWYKKDFYEYFITILTSQYGKEYFGDLSVVGDKIINTQTGEPLEIEDGQSVGLMGYLNGNSSKIEDDELINAAKFIHWLQVENNQKSLIDFFIEFSKKEMVTYSKSIEIDSLPATIWCYLFDIKHQGRNVNWKKIKIKLSEFKNHQFGEGELLNSLYELGKDSYGSRLIDFKEAINKVRDDLDKYVYVLRDKSFVLLK